MDKIINPKVSVIMPVYNGEKYLSDAINSIVNQTFTDFEYLIINDGSTDTSLDIISSYSDPRIQLIHNENNLGLTPSLNKALYLARGDLIARQDADDISHRTRFEKQVNFLDSHPEIALLGTQCRALDKNGKIISSSKSKKPTTNVAVKWHLLFDNSFIHTSVMFRRKIIIDQFHGYDEEAVACEDYELWSRIAQKYAVGNLPYSLVDYRIHSESVMSKNSETNARMHEKIILSNLRRFLYFNEVPAQWPSLLNTLRTGPGQKCIYEPDGLMKIIYTMFFKFCELCPEASVEREIRIHIAEQLSKIAYYSATCDRLISIKVFINAFRINMKDIMYGKVGQIPIHQYFALWLCGESIRNAYRRIIGKSGL